MQPFENAAAKRGSMWQLNAATLKIFTLATGAVSENPCGAVWFSSFYGTHGTTNKDDHCPHRVTASAKSPSVLLFPGNGPNKNSEPRCSSDAKRLRKSGQWTASWLRHWGRYWRFLWWMSFTRIYSKSTSLDMLVWFTAFARGSDSKQIV